MTWTVAGAFPFETPKNYELLFQRFDGWDFVTGHGLTWLRQEQQTGA